MSNRLFKLIFRSRRVIPLWVTAAVLMWTIACTPPRATEEGDALNDPVAAPVFQSVTETPAPGAAADPSNAEEIAQADLEPASESAIESSSAAGQDTTVESEVDVAPTQAPAGDTASGDAVAEESETDPESEADSNGSNAADEQQPVPTQTAIEPPPATATPEPNAIEPTRTPIPSPTADPAVSDPAPQPTLALEADVMLSFSYATIDDPGVNENLVSFSTTIENLRRVDLTIQDGSLVFVDDNYGIYTAIADSTYSPYLVGTTLPPQESLYGFVNFMLPTDVKSGRLIYCPDGPYPCDNPLEETVNDIFG